MPFEKLRGFSSAYALIAPICITIIICCFAFSAFIYYDSKKEIEKARKGMVALDQFGNIYTASYREYSQNDRMIEYKGAVSDFYKLWYQVDEGSFKMNTENALYLLGNCHERLKAEYINNKVHERLKAENLKTSVDIIDIKLDMSKFPIKGECKAIQTIQGGTSTVKIRLNSTFVLSDVHRHDKNRHGVKIDDFYIIDNSPLREAVSTPNF